MNEVAIQLSQFLKGSFEDFIFVFMLYFVSDNVENWTRPVTLTYMLRCRYNHLLCFS